MPAMGDTDTRTPLQQGFRQKVPKTPKNKSLVSRPRRMLISGTFQEDISMSIAKEIAPHLPYLRRFARALTGTQNSGDAYVVAMLEALVLDPSAFPRDLNPRLGLY